MLLIDAPPRNPAVSAATQTSFAAALTDRTKAVPAGVVSWSSEKPSKRFDVYRNNVSSGLTQALAIRFPAVEAIVGKAFFGEMAKAYIAQDPPSSPILLHYGAGFTDFVAAFESAASVPYLADVARVENARVEAYHAADIAPLSQEALAAITSDQADRLTFRFHPSFAVVRSRFPIVTIWAMNCGEIPVEQITDWSAQDALIIRPRLHVLTRRIPPGGAVFLEVLARGHTLGSASQQAAEATEQFDLTANLIGLFQAELATAVHNVADAR